MNRFTFYVSKISTVFSNTSLLKILILLNICFFVVAIFRPSYVLLSQLWDFNSAAEDFMETVRDLEDSSGVEVEQFFTVGTKAFQSLKANVDATKLNSNAVRTSLLEPRSTVFLRNVEDETFDCLGFIEKIFWSTTNTIGVESAPSIRRAKVEGPLNFTHLFTATCAGSNLVVIGHGYNFATTQVIMDQITKEIESKLSPLEDSDAE